MGSGLRSTLIPRYQAAFPGHLQEADTRTNEKADVSLGEAIHFCWYNRYSTLVSLFIFFYLFILIRWQGVGAPTNAHPNDLLKLGKKKWTPMTCAKAIPRQSKELLDNTDQYQRFIDCWEPLFNWQNQIVSLLSLLLNHFNNLIR